MSITRGFGCGLLGTLIGLIVSLWLDIPDDMGWLVGLICFAFMMSFFLLLYEKEKPTDKDTGRYLH